MATNWKELAGVDIRKVINASAQWDTNQNTADSVAPGDELVMTEENRRDQLVAMAVSEVRGAITAGGRYALSLIVAVPPEGEWHTLVMAATRLVNSTPSLQRAFMLGENGSKTVLNQMYDTAMAWVKELREGKTPITPATDPDPASTANGVVWQSENKLIMRTHPVPSPLQQFGAGSSYYANPDGPQDI